MKRTKGLITITCYDIFHYKFIYLQQLVFSTKNTNLVCDYKRKKIRKTFRLLQICINAFHRNMNFQLKQVFSGYL
jgi:hypothetical protein